jgi:hypothetical protein
MYSLDIMRYTNVIFVALILYLGMSFNPFLNWYSGGWSPVGSTRHCGHQWPIVPAPGDYDYGEICGMIGRGNRSTRRKSAPVPLCPPRIPHAARTRTQAVAVGSQRLTAWATARPWIYFRFPTCVISSVFWDIRPYSLLKIGSYRLNIQGRRIRQTRKQHEDVSKQSPALLSLHMAV